MLPFNLYRITLRTNSTSRALNNTVVFIAFYEYWFLFVIIFATATQCY